MSPTKKVLLVLGGVAALGCLGAGALSMLLWGAFSFGPERGWSATAVPEPRVPAVFGVTLEGRALRYQARDLGFQDTHLEAVARLPDGSAERFLTRNGLTRGPALAPEPELLEVVRELEPGTPALTATSFEVAERDGGATLSQHGELLEGAGGVTWVHLVASGM